MPVEVTIAALGAVLLLIHVGAAGSVKTRQYGRDWNMGARRDAAAAQPRRRAIGARAGQLSGDVPDRGRRAVRLVLAGRESHWTALGGWIWLAARVVYLPLYGFGVPLVRSLVLLASLVGLGMALWPLLFG